MNPALLSRVADSLLSAFQRIQSIHGNYPLERIATGSESTILLRNRHIQFRLAVCFLAYLFLYDLAVTFAKNFSHKPHVAPPL